MKIIRKISIAAAVLLFALPFSARAQEIAFVRGNNDKTYIWLYDSVTKKEKKCIEGGSPALSPDGKKIAFVKSAYLPDKAQQSYTIAIYDAEKGVESDLLSPEKESRQKIAGTPFDVKPAWSPDGKLLLFIHFLSREEIYTPVIAAIDGEKAGRKDFMPAAAKNGKPPFNLGTAFWAADSRSIYAVNDSNGDSPGQGVIYRYSLDPEKQGKAIERISQKKVLGGSAGIDFPNITISPDGANWLFAGTYPRRRCAFCDSFCDPGGMGAIFIYDTKAKKTKMLNVGSLCVGDAGWMNSSEIIFSAHRTTEKRSRAETPNIYDIYTVKKSGGTPRKLISNGSDASSALGSNRAL